MRRLRLPLLIKSKAQHNLALLQDKRRPCASRRRGEQPANVPGSDTINSLFTQRAASERSKLSVVATFFQSSTAGGISLPTALCAGIKQREAGRSRKVSCAPMRFNRPRPGSKSRTFCNLCLAKNQRASGRLFLHADYLARAAGAFCSCLALRYCRYRQFPFFACF